jgi:thiamine-monophosphate kinase
MTGERARRRALGEFDLLARVRERLPPPGPRVLLGSGDDAAVTVPGGATATSVDAIVEGVHFRRGEGLDLRAIGAKALAAALSDLAAMGAETGEAYVVIGVPEDLDESGCLEVVDGLVEVAVQTGTSLLGGDVTRSPVLVLAATVVGHAARPGLLAGRDGARAGDALFVTGELGGAAAGLLLQEAGGGVDGVDEATAGRLIERQRRPVPRLAAGRALAAAGASAMIDLSDGLGSDARHLAAASGVGLAIEASALPLAEGVAGVAAALGHDPLQLATSGGEDYELLAAVPADGPGAEELTVAAGVPVRRIGEVVEGSGVEIRLPGGRALQPDGFDHLG